MLSRYVLLAVIVVSLFVVGCVSENKLPDDWSKHWRDCRRPKNPNKKHPDYTYSVLALTWPGNFCGRQDKCRWNGEISPRWDGKSFSIHGFWPSFEGKYVHTGNKRDRSDPCCTYRYDFKTVNTPGLEQFWPDWKDSNFHDYEWSKHGVCYMKVVSLLKYKKEVQDKDKLDAIFQGYFDQTVAKAAKIPKVSQYSFESKSELAEALNLAGKEDYFYVEESRDYPGEITEIRICYDFAAEPGKEELTECSAYNLDNEPQRIDYPLQLHLPYPYSSQSQDSDEIKGKEEASTADDEDM